MITSERVQERSGDVMYYGVFSKDLKSMKFGEGSLEDAREWLSEGYVICSEKEITFGYEFKIQISKHWKWRISKYDTQKRLGFISFEWRPLRYYWADKVVEEYKESEVAE